MRGFTCRAVLSGAVVALALHLGRAGGGAAQACAQPWCPGGFRAGNDAVGSPVVREILSKWEQWRSGPPPLP